MWLKVFGVIFILVLCVLYALFEDNVLGGCLIFIVFFYVFCVCDGYFNKDNSITIEELRGMTEDEIQELIGNEPVVEDRKNSITIDRFGNLSIGG